MAFGRKKNKGSGADAPTETDSTQSPEGDKAVAVKAQPQKKRKAAELLSSVVNESATGAAIDLLKQNEPFALPNGVSWIGLILAVDEIGGLSQKQKGDATKGSIIELIAADKIQVVATRLMLDDEYLGIVPTAETLARMDEYALLTKVEYYWAVFYTDDTGQTLIADAVENVRGTYAQARAISRGELSLSQVLPEVWVWGGGTLGGAAAAAPVSAELAAVGAGTGSSAPTASGADEDPFAGAYSDAADSGAPVEVDYAALAEEDTPGAEPEFDAPGFEEAFANSPAPGTFDPDDEGGAADSWQNEDDGSNDFGADQPDAGYLAYVADNKDRVVDEREVRDTIARRFLSSDLDLVVDLAEFESVFTTTAPAINIAIAENPSDWMGSQVAQLARQANAELELLHQSNGDALRTEFVEIASLHLEQTMAQVSTETPGSQYFNLMAGAKKDFEAHSANGPQEIAAQRAEIKERFKAAADSRAEQAAAHARVVYEDKNRPKLERELAEVGAEMDRRHEEQYNHNRQTVLEMRRKDANVLMDIGTNRIFEHLRERQEVQRDNERLLLEHWNSELTRFIDDNRKDDVARADALALQLARQNEVDALKVDQAARIEELRNDFIERERRLNEQLANNRQEALDKLVARENEWNSSLRLEQERVTNASALNRQLSEQIPLIRGEFEQQYQGRIASLEADKKSSGEELDRMNQLQKRANGTMVVLVVTLTIAALLIGVIAGIAWGNAQHAATGTAVLGSFLTGPAGVLGS